MVKIKTSSNILFCIMKKSPPRYRMDEIERLSMKNCFFHLCFAFLITTILIAACAPKVTLSRLPQKPPRVLSEKSGKCGDSICDGPENPTNCPADCGQKTPVTTTKPTSPSSAADRTSRQAVLYLGVMVHLEGWNDGVNQQRFKEHTRLIREYASLFEAYGARLTWESKEVTDGILKWGDNVLLEMQQRGHGIGLHADLGGSLQYDCARLQPELLAMKQKLQGLGVIVRHTSGVSSHCDWVNAAAETGFQFVTGMVAYGLKSLPLDQQPADIRICRDPSSCHDPYPFTLEERLHPWRANSGSDWTKNNPNGRVVILPENGGLSHKYEDSIGQKKVGNADEFNEADIDAYFIELEKALALADPRKVNTYYMSWSLGSTLDKTLLEKWLQRIQPYVNAGKVQWKTLPEMYDAYVAWEKTQ